MRAYIPHLDATGSAQQSGGLFDRGPPAQQMAMQSQLAEELHLRRALPDAKWLDLGARVVFNKASPTALEENAMAY